MTDSNGYLPDSMLDKLKKRSRELKTDVAALYLACRKGNIPWYTKALVSVVVAYALSPIDLIPDFIPVLGYLDDLVLIPLGIAIAIKLIPTEVMAECRREAEDFLNEGVPRSRVAGAVILIVWILIITAILLTVLR